MMGHILSSILFSRQSLTEDDLKKAAFFERVNLLSHYILSSVTTPSSHSNAFVSLTLKSYNKRKSPLKQNFYTLIREGRPILGKTTYS